MTESNETLIGNSLRNRRIELGISFDEVVSRTRIRRSYLEALEQDRFEEFPGDAYLKGYLKGYADCLGLDPQPLLDSLPSKKPLPQSSSLIESVPLPPLGGGSTRSPVLLLGAFVLAGLLILLALGWLWFDRQSSAPQSEQVSQAAVTPSRESLVSAAVAPASNPVENREVPTADQTIPAPESAAVTAAVEAGTAATPISAASGAGSLTAVTEPVAQDVILPRSDAGVLRLQATGQGQLELTIDGRPAQRYSLQANTILSWKIGRTVRVYLENPGSARLWLGGREVDLAGRSQIVLQLEEKPGR